LTPPPPPTHVARPRPRRPLGSKRTRPSPPSVPPARSLRLPTRVHDPPFAAIARDDARHTGKQIRAGHFLFSSLNPPLATAPFFNLLLPHPSSALVVVVLIAPCCAGPSSIPFPSDTDFFLFLSSESAPRARDAVRQAEVRLQTCPCPFPPAHALTALAIDPSFPAPPRGDLPPSVPFALAACFLLLFDYAIRF
jgi:hypothetical protein